MNIKNKWCLPVITLIMAACGSTKERGVTITANIKGLDAGELIYYAPQSDQGKAQTVIAEADKFTIQIPVAAGQGDWYKVWIGGSPLADNIISVYADSGEVKLTGSNGGFKNVAFSGKPTADDYDDFLKTSSQSVDKFYAWIAAHPASPLATALLQDYLSKGAAIMKDTALALMAHRDAAAMNNLPAKRLIEWKTLLADVVPGKPAPVFSMSDTSGKQVSLHDFKGKYILLDFWASWCVPCRAENPNVVKAFNAFKDKGFTVLGISLDMEGDRGKWLAAIHKDNLQWTHLSDLKYFENAVAKQYHIQSIPSNFLIDPNGVIIARDLRGENLEKKLSAIFPQ